MRVIVAGSRGITDAALVAGAIERSGFEVTEVVCGEAPGVDTLGRRWAEARGIPVKSFPADWKRHGKLAGPLRNGEMARYAEALVAVRAKGASPGTDNMVRQARGLGLRVHIEAQP